MWALFVYGLVLLYLLAPVKEKRPILPACACVVTLCLSALLTAKTAQRQDLALTVLDVGQGQSVVLYDGDVCLGGAVADAAGMTAEG